MAEIYPFKVPGEYAGEWCDVKLCKNYARHVLSPMGLVNGKLKVCGQHLSPAVRGLCAQYSRALAIQEIPGVSAHDGTAVIDGRIVMLTRTHKREIEQQ